MMYGTENCYIKENLTSRINESFSKPPCNALSY